MKPLCDWYIRHAKIIGSLYCIVPTVIWFVIVLAAVPFRAVYVLRLVLACAVGGLGAAYLNERGLSFWLIKHRSADGPATVVDGALIGAAIGVGAICLSSLTSLIGTHHLEAAKWFIIASWIAGAVVGGAFGTVLGWIGFRHLESGGQRETGAGA